MIQAEIDELLARFNGKPGTTEGLSHEETLAMLQAMIDNGRIYADAGLCAFADAFAEVGDITGYDKTKAPKETYE